MPHEHTVNECLSTDVKSINLHLSGILVAELLTLNRKEKVAQPTLRSNPQLKTGKTVHQKLCSVTYRKLLLEESC